MSNIAVIKLAGAQHVVKAGDKFEVNRLNVEISKEMPAEVLLSTKDSELLLNSGDVKIKVLENKLGEKLKIVKFRAKSRYRRAQGHRQPLSLVEVISVNGESKESSNSEKKVSKSKKTKEEAK